MATHVVKLNGIDVPFRFEPYQLQKAYMNQVIRSARDRKNALLESPTGTGKTLSLLCASLAWLNHEIKLRIERLRVVEEILMSSAEESDVLCIDQNQESSESKHDKDDEHKPRIYFSSRTHSQLSQSIKELKRSNYNNNSAVVLAGRDVLCLNEEVQKLDSTTAKNQACQSKIGKRCSCKFYKDIEKRVIFSSDYVKNLVLDVEDLMDLGKKHTICPYFASKIIQRKKNVTFLPYNYLLDPLIRKGQAIGLANSVVIFDEGHNIERICEDSFSFDLSSADLAECLENFGQIYQCHQQCVLNKLSQSQEIIDSLKEFSTENLITMKEILDCLKMQIDSKVTFFADRHGKTKGDVCDSDWLFQVLDKCGLNVGKIQQIADISDKIQRFLYCLLPFKGSKVIEAASSMNCIKNFLSFLSVLFPDESVKFEAFKEEFKMKFRVFIEITESKSILHIWCLSPSIALKSLINSNVRSVVMTSGTLAPLNSFESEFDTKFDCKIQNPHIIKRSQMAIYPVSESYNSVRLDSTFSNKDNIEYYKALGDTIVDICAHVPDGVLIFFQSYAVMNNSIKKWRDHESVWKIWSKLNKLKPVHQEVKRKEEFNQTIRNYRNSVEKGKGAAFFAICRGKLSEGIDLGGHFARAVILVGLPYPSTQDPRVKMKRNYLDAVKYQDYTSNDWYSLQMKRALNQAIGRAIRHKSDYGCVFLLDYRFVIQTKDLSRWCRDFVRNPSTYRDMVADIRDFYAKNILDETSRTSVKAVSSVEDVNVEEDENNNLESDCSDHEEDNTTQSKKRDIGDLCDTDHHNIKKLKKEESERSKKIRRHIAIEYEVEAPVTPGSDPIIIFDE